MHEDLVNPLVESKYDLVYCVDVLEHLDNDEAVIGNLFCALKPGCNLLLHVPLQNQRRFFRYFKNWMQHDHIRDGYDEQSLVNILKKTGFVVIDKKYTFGWIRGLAWEINEIFWCFTSLPS